MKTSYSQLIHLAASLAKSRYFGQILKLCYRQESISTKKLKRIIEDAEESQKIDADIIAKSAQRIRELEEVIDSCKLTLQTISRESGMNLNDLVCWDLINKVNKNN